jgi:plastocyanin
MARVVTVVAAVCLALGACGGNDSNDESTVSGASPPVSLTGSTNNHGTKAAKDELEVEADDFYFGPTFIKAKANQAFTVEIHNEGKATHTFTISALGVDETLEPGAKRTVKLTAPASGSAQFFCRFHVGQGMQGAVFVG